MKKVKTSEVQPSELNTLCSSFRVIHSLYSGTGKYVGHARNFLITTP